MAYLLARVENFPRFEGETLTAKPVMGHGQSGKPPHEAYNFSLASDGFIYGYLPKGGGGDLARLGGDREAKEVSGVTVIFISSGAPYSENFETRALNVSDLAVLCANCHRMIHRMPDLADIKALMDYVLND